MQYTVKQLSTLSGVSVRTLHYYDEIGLLKPAHIGESGYRYYQENELLRLQQILFLKELGFALQQIRKMLKQTDSARIDALRAQKELLQNKIVRLQALMHTIDATIDHVAGKQRIMEAELFNCFLPDSKQQRKYQNDLQKYVGVNHGVAAMGAVEESYRRTMHWNKEDWQKAHEESKAIAQELLLLMQQRYAPDAHEVQNVIKKHYAWIRQFWTPTKELYKQHADFIMASELKQFYDVYHKDLAKFLAQAIIIYAEKNV